MTEREKEEWWDLPAEPKKPKPTIEELMNKIDQMRRAQEGIPKGLVILQFIALVFVIVNLAFIYTNISHPMAFFIAIYMVPSTLIFAHYLILLRQLKLIASGEKQ